MSKYKNEARELGNLMLKLYEREKYKETYSVWGVSFGWNPQSGEVELNFADNDFTGMMLHALRQVDNVEGLVRPPNLIPRDSEPYTHYTMLAAANMDRVIEEFAGIHGNVNHELERIIDGSALLTEAAETYLNECNTDEFNKVGFIDFLIRYVPGVQYDSSTAQGIYKHAIQREAFASSPENVFDRVIDKLPVRIGKRVCLINEASQEVDVPEGLLALYRRVVRPSDSTIEEEEITELHSLTSFLGRRLGKRRTPCSSAEDAQTFLERQRRQGQWSSIDPVRVYSERVQHIIDQLYFEIFREDPERALKEINCALKKADDAELRALKKTREMLLLMRGFEDSNHINHNMRITQKNGGG